MFLINFQLWARNRELPGPGGFRQPELHSLPAKFLGSKLALARTPRPVPTFPNAVTALPLASCTWLKLSGSRGFFWETCPSRSAASGRSGTNAVGPGYRAMRHSCAVVQQLSVLTHQWPQKTATASRTRLLSGWSVVLRSMAVAMPLRCTATVAEPRPASVPTQRSDAA